MNPRRWQISYELVSRFSSPVSENYYKLRFFPKDTDRQKTLSMEFRVETSSWHSTGKDSFGNTFCIGSCMKPHSEFKAVMLAAVEKQSGASYEPANPVKLGMYKCATRLTYIGEELSRFARNISPQKPVSSSSAFFPSRESALGSEDSLSSNAWDRTLALMSSLSASFSYQSGATHFNTTAEQAFKQGKGVCQDYAHILLALCRREGIISRYVAGMIPGEGATHAWIEVYSNGYWKGFDPTHNRETDDSYITFSVGLDAQMCALNRGVFKRGIEIAQQVRAEMHE